MRHLYSACLLAATLLAGTATPAMAADCPARDFRGFLAAFMDNSAVQRAHVTVPLLSSTIDAEAEPEPATVVKRLTASQIRYPLVPTRADRTKSGLVTSTKSLSATDTEVKLAQSDGGYQLRYLFRKSGPCWTLVKMSDDAL